MKKVSTGAVREAKNFSEQKLTIGLDLGDRSSWYCVLDEAGVILLEQRLSTTPKAMREVFDGMPRSRIALETGMHSPWISRLLSGLGHEVIVAHARNVRLIGEGRPSESWHYCGFCLSGFPIASRNTALLPFACGEKKLTTSSSKKVSPVAPRC